MAQRGTSSVPLIMGIIASVLAIPSVLCSMLCTGTAEAIGAMAEAHRQGLDISQATPDGQATGGIMLIGLIGALIGLAGGILGKRLPVPSGIMMLLGCALSAVLCFSGNAIALLVALLYLIGAAFCFAQKREDVK